MNERALFFRFFHDDWLRDTRPLSLTAKGAWIEIICLAWSNATSMLQADAKQWSRWIGTDEETLLGVLLELERFRIADIIRHPDSTISIECRRMRKDLILNSEERKKSHERAVKAAAKRYGKDASSSPQAMLVACSEQSSSNACALPSTASTASTKEAVVEDASRPPENAASQNGATAPNPVSVSLTGPDPWDRTKHGCRELLGECQRRGWLEVWAETWWLDHDGKGWVDWNGNPIRNRVAAFTSHGIKRKQKEDEAAAKFRAKEEAKVLKAKAKHSPSTEDDRPAVPTPLEFHGSPDVENPFPAMFAENAERRRKHEEWLSEPHGADEKSPYLP